jgi:CMP-N-acetylneuraminic acid synthetase
MGERAICLIPAKAASTRLPRKNLLPLGGHPLVAHSIRKAMASGLFDTIMVSTEDSELAEVARRYGADVPFARPERLSRDPATIVDVVLHALDSYAANGQEFSLLCILLPTTPFVTVRDICEAYRVFQRSKGDVLLSVTATEFPPFNAWIMTQGGDRLAPCFPDSPYKHVKSTECPTAYRSNGAIIFADCAALRAHRSYYRTPPVPFVMPQERSLDIDTEFEYRVARALWDAGIADNEKGLFQ